MRTGAFILELREWGKREWEIGKRKRAASTANPDSRLPVSFQLCEKFLDALQAAVELRARAGIGDAQRARLAEGRTRHGRHALGFQQCRAEIHVVLDARAMVRFAERDRNIRKRVERALRTRALHAGNREQRIQHLVAAL